MESKATRRKKSIIITGYKIQNISDIVYFDRRSSMSYPSYKKRKPTHTQGTESNKTQKACK